MTIEHDLIEAERQKLLGRNAATEQSAPTAITSKRSKKNAPSDRLLQLQQAAQRAKKQRIVFLPDLSRAYNARVEVRLSDVSFNEVLASGLIPGQATKVISQFVERSEELSQEDRDRVGMADIAKEIIDDEYNGDSISVWGGLIQLTRVMAVLGTEQFLFDGEANDPPVELTLDESDDTKLYIGVLTDVDVNILGGTIWKNIEGDAAQADPFPGARDAVDLVRQGETVVRAAERSDAV